MCPKHKLRTLFPEQVVYIKSSEKVFISILRRMTAEFAK